jgi:hypothetical protein
MHRGRQPRVRAIERIDDPYEADERVLEHLAQLGDLHEPREARHFVLLPDRTAADRVAIELGAEGWHTRVERTDECWVVVASRVRLLTPALVRATRLLLDALARRHGGLYDGWETPTV